MITDEDGVVLKFFNTQQAYDFKEAVAGNMVDDCAVFDGGNHKLFSFHRHQVQDGFLWGMFNKLVLEMFVV